VCQASGLLSLRSYAVYLLYLFFFNSAKVQILTPEELRARLVRLVRWREPAVSEPGTQFTCFAVSKVQTLTQVLSLLAVLVQKYKH